jgi:hypothetical protein
MFCSSNVNAVQMGHLDLNWLTLLEERSIAAAARATPQIQRLSVGGAPWGSKEPLNRSPRPDRENAQTVAMLCAAHRGESGGRRELSPWAVAMTVSTSESIAAPRASTRPYRKATRRSSRRAWRQRGTRGRQCSRQNMRQPFNSYPACPSFRTELSIPSDSRLDYRAPHIERVEMYVYQRRRISA